MVYMLPGLTTKQLCPSFVAPNLLTLAGFLLSVAHFVLLTLFNPTMRDSSDTPRWAYFLTGLLIFISYTLDGIDGKQARKTNSSSALGELFDHGCDSWVAVLLPCAALSLLGDHITPEQFVHLQWVGIVGFIVTHWEKYLTGTLYLPWMFDISQVGFAITMCAFGLSNIPIPDADVIQLIVKAVLVIFLFVYLPQTVGRCLFLETKRQDLQRSHYFTPLADMAVLMVISYTWLWKSPTLVHHTNPRLFVYFFGTVSSNITTRLMVAQLGKMEVTLFTPLLRLFLLVAMPILGLTVFYPAIFHSFVNLEYNLLWLGSIVATVGHIVYSKRLISEMCDTIGIYAFSLKRPHKSTD